MEQPTRTACKNSHGTSWKQAAVYIIRMEPSCYFPSHHFSSHFHLICHWFHFLIYSLSLLFIICFHLCFFYRNLFIFFIMGFVAFFHISHICHLFNVLIQLLLCACLHQYIHTFVSFLLHLFFIFYNVHLLIHS